jgi:enediyne polyketide synthase
MSSAIAIVGMACCYPDARSPQELWENVLARRRAFRRFPAERLSLSDYFSSNALVPDAIYSAQAALIADYEFDRVGFRVSGPIFRSVDMAHWLALDVASRALEDAGFLNGNRRPLPQESTGVLVGNTLTGEFSRAATLRLRWPYVRRVVEARLKATGWTEENRSAFLGDLEQDYKVPFAPVGEETLAGALSNTIAGRICNHFHLGGGGYTLDGACCSSLLAVARACSALAAGELDLALAGGVDVSLDPFELVGFAKTGALAHGEMLVYDRESSGFLPGEGSGFVVLMRAEDARAQGLRSYGSIRGWGISSDGSGSITRPEVRGQLLALRRAYQRAGYGAETVAFFEGHGTGTPVGDEVELQALTALREQDSKIPAAAVGSIKANIGHTKAAAGVAGLIKATLAVHHQILPPATGMRQPRPELTGERAVLRALETAETWPEVLPLRAGVNSFGFGGINVHVTVEGVQSERGTSLSPTEQMIVSSSQDAELFLLTADSRTDLAAKVDIMAARASGLSYAELADASAALVSELNAGPWRAAAVATSPTQLSEQLAELRQLLDQGVTQEINLDRGVFLGVASATRPRIGFVFPGQASPVRLRGGAHGRRFACVRELYEAAKLNQDNEGESTAVAQIAIATAEAAGLRLMSDLGIEASVAVGHSLGELAAYFWAGAFDEESLLALVRARGRAMAELPGPPGAMASISADAHEVEALLYEADVEAKAGGARVVIACFNGPEQVVVAGERESVAQVVTTAQGRGWSATSLPTANAFHSPAMEPAKASFRKYVNDLDPRPLQRRLMSTITGTELPSNIDLKPLLVEQLTSPVRFAEALTEAGKNVDLFVEVGPGRILSHLSGNMCSTPSITLDVAGPSLVGVLHATAAAHVLGAQPRTEVLFKDRFVRPFDFNRRPKFFVNPCELAPVSPHAPGAISSRAITNNHSETPAKTEPVAAAEDNALDVVRTLIAQRTELPPAAISETAHLLRDLHLNSIVVGELVAAAARLLHLTPPRQLLEFADATVGETAKALKRMRRAADGTSGDTNGGFAGVDDWQRAFFVDWLPRPLRKRTALLQPAGRWRVFAAGHPELAAALSSAALPGNGVIVCLPPGLLADSLEELAGTLLEAARASLETKGKKRYFVVTGAAGLASAFARTLHLEDADVLMRIVEAPLDSHLVNRVIDEIHAPGECIDARYDHNGARTQSALRLVDQRDEMSIGIPLGQQDVVLVSGGAKGIVAECSMTLARETGAALAILGRSCLQDDSVVATHLQKLASLGVRAHYISTDVTDPTAVRSAVADAEARLGRVTAIIHGAGHNEPRLLRDLDRPTLLRTLAPKVEGLRNLVAAVDADGLRLFVTFGSVIGRAGLRGEADYALANACQSSLTDEFARRHPDCRCLAFESSAWSGIGMAQRLGSLETLRHSSITAIPPEQGVAWFRELVSRRLPATSVMLAGRLGTHPPLPMEGSLPLRRFLEKPRVFYPRVELVCDAELSTASDPYLLDHVFQEQPLLPGVIALEAMTQAAMAVTGETRLPVLSDVRFDRPLVVVAGARVTLRVAALVREPGRVEVVVRSSNTSFQVDHFRCLCAFTEPALESAQQIAPPDSRLPVDPQADLYGNLLFHSGRFRRLAGYRFLNARSCWAEIAPIAPAKAGNGSQDGSSWFSQYLPSALVLGDAAARDAALHAVQACVPHAVLLPIGVKRLHVARLNAASQDQLFVHAHRRWVEGATYCYDVELRTTDGVLLEKWEELQLRKVADAANHSWPDALVAAFVEWRVEESIPAATVAAAFDRDRSDDRRSRSERAIQKALAAPHPVHWRADGKPELQVSAMGVSASHSNGLTLAVAGPSPLACDMEPVRARSEQVWRDLLGRDRWSLAELIAAEAGEDVQTSATRVWTALESLKKAEAPHDAPLVLLSCSQGSQGCVSLSASGLRISTSIVEFRDDPTPFAVSVLAREPS